MADENAIALGRFFRSHRLAAGIEAYEASLYLDPNQPGLVARYEDGREALPAHHVFALSNLYGVPPDEIVTFLYDLLRMASGAERKAGHAD